MRRDAGTRFLVCFLVPWIQKLHISSRSLSSSHKEPTHKGGDILPSSSWVVFIVSLRCKHEKSWADSVCKVPMKRTGILHAFQGNLSTWPTSLLMTSREGQGWWNRGGSQQLASGHPEQCGRGDTTQSGTAQHTLSSLLVYINKCEAFPLTGNFKHRMSLLIFLLWYRLGPHLNYFVSLLSVFFYINFFLNHSFSSYYLNVKSKINSNIRGF